MQSSEIANELLRPFNVFIKNINLDRLDIVVGNISEFKRNVGVFRNFFALNAINEVVFKRKIAVSPQNGIRRIDHKIIDRHIFYMMQRRKLFIFRTVNGKSIIRFIVAIAVDEHHITIFRTICICIGIFAGNNDIIQCSMKQIIQCAAGDLAFGTDGNDIIAVGKF